MCKLSDSMKCRCKIKGLNVVGLMISQGYRNECLALTVCIGGGLRGAVESTLRNLMGPPV